MLFPPPGDLPHPGIEPASLASPALARGFFTSGATREALSTRKEPHKRNELGSRQSMSSSPAAHTTLVPKAFPCGPGLCSSEQKTVSSAWLGPESHGQRSQPSLHLQGPPAISSLLQRLGQGSELTGSPHTHCLYSNEA